MSFTLSEYLTAQFYIWERVGRGQQSKDKAVHLEPEYIEFLGHFPPERKNVDTGIRPRLFPELQEFLGIYTPPKGIDYEESVDLLKEKYVVSGFPYSVDQPIAELQIVFDRETRIPFDTIEQLVMMIATDRYINSFEIIGTGEDIVIQFAVPEFYEETVRSFISVYANGVGVLKRTGFLSSLLNLEEKAQIYIEFALGQEFVRPLKVWQKFDPDPLSGIISVMERLKDGEIGILQVLFQKTLNPWAVSIGRAVGDGAGGHFFEDDAQMLPLAQEKVRSPLLSCAIRTIGQADSVERAREIAADIGMRLETYSRAGSNELYPIRSSEEEVRLESFHLFDRQSLRFGMILNSEELSSIVHIPDPSLVSSKLRSFSGKSYPAPKEVQVNKFFLGINSHLGIDTPVTVSDEQRLRHMHIIGATGTGKSTLIKEMVLRDIKDGRGVCILDPHGDLIDDVVGEIPDERLQDVVLLDPSDSEFPVGLNLLSADGDEEKAVLSSDLVGLFKRFATSWGDTMDTILGNAINAVLDSTEGGTLLDLKRFLVEPGFREKLLKTVKDPQIIYYWRNEFKLLRGTSIGSILTRLDTFMRPRIIRNMMAQKGGLDFKEIMNGKKIFLVKLAQGLIGEDNCFVLGTLIVAKIQQAAQSRQKNPAYLRTPFYFYIDEFQNFITLSMSGMLAGARKNGLGLILAHQDLEQLARKNAELANSVISNPAIRICFRVGDRDAGRLSDGFEHFSSSDLQSLSIGECIARVIRKDHDFSMKCIMSNPVDEIIARDRKLKILLNCRWKYAKAREEIEASLRSFYGMNKEEFSDYVEVQDVKSEQELEEEIQDEVEPVKRNEDPIEVFQSPVSDHTTIQDQSDEYKKTEKERESIRLHSYLQQRIRKTAQDRGFKSDTEKEVNEGRGRVDVSIENDQVRIAIEVAVANTKEYELGNIRKCLDAKYDWVIVTSKDSKHLKRIRQYSAERLEKRELEKVSFLVVDKLSGFLDAVTTSDQTSEKVEQGYRVRTTYSEGQKEQLNDRIKRILGMIYGSKKSD